VFRTKEVGYNEEGGDDVGLKGKERDREMVRGGRAKGSSSTRMDSRALEQRSASLRSGSRVDPVLRPPCHL